MKDSLSEKVQRLLAAGRGRDACAILQRACVQDSGDAGAWSLLGTLEGRAGRYEQAERACRQALKARPDHPAALANLGNALAMLGRHNEAVTCHRQRLHQTPDDPAALANLGSALCLAGEYDEAERCLRRAIDLEPACAGAHFNLGNVLARQGRLDEAIERYAVAAQRNPRLHAPHQELGEALRITGRLSEAADALNRALALDPHAATTLLSLAALYTETGRPDQALACHQHVVERYGDRFPLAWIGMANGLINAGNLDAAEETLNRFLERHPDHPQALVARAEIWERRGDPRRAREYANAAVAAGRQDAAVALLFAQTSRTRDERGESLALLERLLAREDGDEAARRSLHFETGRLYDAQGDYARAMKYYRAANRLTGYRFDRVAHSRAVTGLIERFDSAAMARLPRSGETTQRPLFIVGMPRSGTSLVEQILSRHPDVAVLGERSEISQIAAALGECHPPGTLATPHPERLTAAALRDAAHAYLSATGSTTDKSAARFTDKMPHNFWNLGLINLLLPGARVIHCVRDPRDTGLSIYFQSFTAAHPYATDLDDIVFYFEHYRRLMAHWKSVIDLPMFEVRYESLVREPAPAIQKLLDFCGLPWNDGCLNPQQSDRYVVTASYNQVRRPLYTSSIGRWTHYREWLGPLAALESTRLDQPPEA